MPIHINEIIIRAVIDKGGASGGGETSDAESMIADCVEQVLEILKDTKER